MKTQNSSLKTHYPKLITHHSLLITLHSLLFLLFALHLHAQSEWSLQQCIDHALENNIDLKKQQELVEQYGEQYDTSHKGFWPTISASIAGEFHSHFKTTVGLDTEINPYSNSDGYNIPDNVALGVIGANVSLSMPLFDGGKNRNQMKSDKATLESSEWKKEDLNQQLKITIAKAYYQVLYCQSVEMVAAEHVSFYQNLLERIVKKVKNGTAKEVNRIEVEAQLAEAKYQQTVAENNTKKGRFQLAKLINVTDIDTFSISDSSVTLPDDSGISTTRLFSELLVENQPLIHSLLSSLSASSYNVAIAHSELFPKVSLVAGFGTSSYTPTKSKYRNLLHGFTHQLGDYFDPYIGIHVDIPILSAGKLTNNVRKAKHARNLAELDIAQARQDLRQDIQEAYINVDNAHSQYLASKESEESARDLLNTISNDYQKGSATIYDVQKANTNLLEAEQNTLQGLYNYAICQRIISFY